MVPTSTQPSLMNELASHMVTQFETFFERLNASTSLPIPAFPVPDLTNYIYILYTGNGMSLELGVVIESMSERDVARLTRDAHDLGTRGIAASFRYVALGSEEIALQLRRLIKDLFHATLPLNVVVKTEEIAPVAVATEESPIAVGRRGTRPV